MSGTKISAFSVLLLLISFLIYSSSGIFLKMTSLQDFPSLSSIFFFLMVVLTLAIYAVLWQIVLKRIPLAQAFLFKSITIIYSFCFAYAIFGESISWKNMLGALFIIFGIIINAQSKERV